ncbi:molybdate ABC transporter substrate-binding protein [Pelagicoccus mobilis]|uniref:Molybdate ABC transporter substrate-binding protein n=1 Tax=Pelagicoccus mobilis TaxID=415221 RepID=A0A934VQT9_9BACT|nr:molybdate ABC transporter substrate-binding protein [Pelagicoccus mobilis]MBK1878692.1 molybdate ABC transporter substrate-binding protein [Pelagicoccus mobilis]
MLSFLRIRNALMLALCCAALLGCGKRTQNSHKTLTVFVAASLTDVIQEIGRSYTNDNGIELVYNFAGTGALARQLIASPKADLFISADPVWMEKLAQAGRVDSTSIYPLLSNQLVLIAHQKAEETAASIQNLCEASFSYLAIGDPSYVPAGNYAKRVLESVSCPERGSLWDSIQAEGRLSPCPDVRAALAQVAGSKDVLGIVYRTDALARSEEVKILSELPQPTEEPILYPAAVLNSTAQPSEASRFLSYLQGPNARQIFESAGFVVTPGK